MKPLPRTMWIAFQNNQFLAASADDGVIKQLVKDRQEFSDQNGKGWVLVFDKYKRVPGTHEEESE